MGNNNGYLPDCWNELAAVFILANWVDLGGGVIWFSDSHDLFCSEFLGDGLILSSLLFFGTMIVGVASIYTNFSQPKTLLIVGLCTVFFIASMYLYSIGGYILKGKNPFYGSSKQMQPLLNERVEISTDDPKQLYLNGKTGKLTEINRYEVTVKLDDKALMWPYVDVWWQDIKAVDS